MQRLEMKNFNTDKNSIESDLTVYIDFVENTFTYACKSVILNKFVTIEDYVYILYYLRFEKQLSYSEIGKKIYPENKNFHNSAYVEYLRLGLNFSTNYDETKEKFTDEQNKLRVIKEKSYTISVNELNLAHIETDEYYALIENFKRKFLQNFYHSKVYSKYGYHNLEDYFKGFYYFVKVCEISTPQISRLFGYSSTEIKNRLREMGLSIDIKTAQENAVKHNRRNYKNTLLAGRKSVNKYLSKNASFGSILENSIRNKFAVSIAGYINTSKYEVVIGINNKSIIAPKEVDIPIIIIDSLKKKVYKFAVEINGDIFHKDDDREKIKIKLLNNKNWIYYSIWQSHSTKEQKVKYGTIEEQINQICININRTLQEN